MTVVPWSGAHGIQVVDVQDLLWCPVNGALRHTVRGLLRRGERRVVLDLARVSRIDAAGVGELVRVHNMAIAVNGVLRIAHATAWVREILERVGLFDILSVDRDRGVKVS